MVNLKSQISNLKLLELLAPARNADTGIEAIRHGADAVYIGAHAFGARAAAANQLDDIRRLVAFAHLFHAKVYVTVNTIVYDDELLLVERLVRDLYEAGVDALIVQDMALLGLSLPPIPLHASTQMDNRTPDKAEALQALGFEQVVLARELSLTEISDIHRRCPQLRLEAFVHGALCVSYSGQCFVSQALFQRSANRGECAQVCRMEFDLENAQGEKLLRGKHLLSLKDLCQLDCLDRMAEAGVSSFKIEGRLKDMSYVKNVTAAYSQKLDELVERFPDRYARASRGNVRLLFQPDVSKSFNRGFTHYFLFGKNDDIFAFSSPKAIGKRVGRIREVFTNHILVEPDHEEFPAASPKTKGSSSASTVSLASPKKKGSSPSLAGQTKSSSPKPSRISFANGDGLCCLTPDGRLIGFRVNRVDADRLFPLKMPQGLRRGMILFRNYDKRFEEILAADSAERTIPVSVSIDYDRHSSEFILSMEESPVTPHNSHSSHPSHNSSSSVSLRIPFLPELARTPQRDNIFRQFSRLGNTPLRLESLNINYKENFFIPSSLLSQWRRELSDLFLSSSPSTPSDQSDPSSPSSPSSPSTPSSLSDPSDQSDQSDQSDLSDSSAQSTPSDLSSPSSLSAQSDQSDPSDLSSPSDPSDSSDPSDLSSALSTISANLNIANRLSRDFYARLGLTSLPAAFELDPSPSTPLMTCRHCIRYALGWCAKRQSVQHSSSRIPPLSAPLFLTLRNGIRLSLHFDCTRCLMTVHTADSH